VPGQAAVSPEDPQPIAAESNVPIVVQDTRFGSWESEHALLTTITYPG
jgi:hypothetical protein